MNRRVDAGLDGCKIGIALLLVTALGAAGCGEGGGGSVGQSTKSSSASGSPSASSGVPSALENGESDQQVHERAVVFEQTYMKMHHVDLETAQCVQGATDAVATPEKMEAALHVNPRRTPVGDCTK
jgi:hypothetical protein